MQDPNASNPLRFAMSLTAALLLAPSLVIAQPATSPGMPSVTAPSAAPAAILPMPGNPPVSFGPGSAVAARPRLSQIIGGAIYDERDQKIGEVDDVLLTAESATAIVQVGGFLGLGGRLVSLPLAGIRWNAERGYMVLPGASKESLEARPAFEYATLRAR